MLEEELCIYIPQTKTNRSHSVSLPARLSHSRQRREDWNVVACCSRWLPASSSSSSSLSLILLPPVEEDTHTPEPSALFEIPACRSFITKGLGHLKLEFVVCAHVFFFLLLLLGLTRAFCTSLPIVRLNESMSQWHQWEIYFKHLWEWHKTYIYFFLLFWAN